MKGHWGPGHRLCLTCELCIWCKQCGCQYPQPQPTHPRRTAIYVIGSMRNPRVPEVARSLRALGYDAFDDWYSAGPEADDKWQEYEKSRGRTFAEALQGYHAKHVFELDLFHLDRCAAAVLVAPAGKSAHSELGYMRGAKKPTFYLLDGEPERFDVMVQFASEGVFTDFDKFASRLSTVLA